MISIGLVICLALISFPSKSAEYITEPPALYEQIAIENKVPAKLFYALILNESRSKVSLNKTSTLLPWPWTVNHQGKGLYFSNRKDAFSYIQSLVDSGDVDFGVGLGQLEWRWHKGSFKSPWHSLEPRINLTIAAKYFRKQFDRNECSTWKLAVGCYHRPGQSDKDKLIAKAYTKRVLKIWNQLNLQ